MSKKCVNLFTHVQTTIGSNCLPADSLSAICWFWRCPNATERWVYAKRPNIL